MKTFAGAALAAALLAGAGSAIAHHSYAMFDLKTKSKISGTVAKVEWTNPHIFVWVYVPDAQGKQELWGIEGGAISLLTRYGWKKDSIRAGEKVTIEYFPLKDGRKGGAFISATHADGTVTKNEPFAPGGSDPSAYKTDSGKQDPSKDKKP